MNLIQAPPTFTDSAAATYTLDPVGSPLYFVFQAANEYAAVKAKAQITVTSSADGGTITIAQPAANLSTVFTFVDVLTEANQLPSDGDVLQWANIIADAADIANSYVVYVQSGKIVLEAKTAGSYYSLTVTSSVATTILTAGSDDDKGMALQGYNYAQWVAVEQTNPTGSTVLQRLAVLVAPFNPDNRYVFDVSRVLQAITPFVLPTRVAEEFIAAVAHYRLTYGEQYSGGYNTYTNLPSDSTISRVQRYAIGTTSKRQAMLGVWTDQNSYSNNTAHWPSLVTGGDPTDLDDVRPVKWLTRRPYQLNLRREAAPYWPVHIAIYPYRPDNFPVAFYELHAFRYGHDGQLIDEYTQQLSAITAEGIYCFDLWANLVNVGDPDLVARVNYELRYGGVAITEELVLTIANRDDGYQQFPIYWRGGIGVLEHFTLLGYKVTEQRTDRTRIEATIVPPLESRTYQGDADATPSIESKPRLRITANTGWVDADTYEYLKDLTASLQSWTLGSSGLLETLEAAGYDVDGVDATQWVALSIVDSSWESNPVDGLFNATITFEVSAQFSAERR